jgi:hypothetical protein
LFLSPGLNDLVFTGWDIFEDDMYSAAGKAGVLDRSLLEQVKPFLSSIKPRKAVFDKNYVKRLDGPNVKKGKNKMELAEQVRDDIREFKQSSGAERLVMIWCGSTETFIEAGAAHQSVEALEKAMLANDEAIAPSMLYAYAALKEGVPFANGAPNLTVDIRAMHELSKQMQAPICGKDFKTGQTLIKTILAPRLQGAHDRAERMVLHQYSRQPRRRSAGRSRDLSRRRKNRSCQCWSTSCSPSCIPNSTAICATRFASIIIRRAETTKRAGTTSTSSAGSATPCRSRWIFFAGIRSSPRRSCLIWCC